MVYNCTMKFLPSIVAYFFEDRSAKANVSALLRFVVLLAGIMVASALAFQHIMLWEGREYSFIQGFYWTVVTMTTLGYGDITFYSDLGKAFSVLVLLSGVLFLLVMLPFTFIRFFYAPWLEAQNRARTPRKLADDARGHVLLGSFDPLVANLIEKLRRFNYDYAIIVPEQQQALDLYNQGYRVMLGELDDIGTYRNAHAEHASLVFFNGGDYINTHAIFTLREHSTSAPVVATAHSPDSVDILELAGASQVYQFSGMLGRSLARRVLGVGMHANVIGRFGQTLIAEFPAMRTKLEGRSISEARLRELSGVNVVGVWDRGSFSPASAATVMGTHTVLVLAGSQSQLEQFSNLFGAHDPVRDPVLIIGAGNEGTAAAHALKEVGVAYRVVEKSSGVAGGQSGQGGHTGDGEDQTGHDDTVLGNAADIMTLKRAGIDQAPSVIITTKDDDVNIYLTIYCRKLRPDIQIISRATQERSIPKLHAAGADLVMSYASMGANTVINYLKGDDVLMVAEGLDVFRETVPASLAGKTLAQSEIRSLTGCNVVSIESRTQGTFINPDPGYVLKQTDELILIGSFEAEHRFQRLFKAK